MNRIEMIDREQVKKLAAQRAVPEFVPGDTVKVSVKVVEGERVERIFPLYSPRITAIEVMRRGSVRRAKLYYLRGLTGKKARIQERARDLGLAPEPEAAAAPAPAEATAK